MKILTFPYVRAAANTLGAFALAAATAQTALACDFNASVAVCNQASVDALQFDLTSYFLDTRTTEFWPHVRILANKSVVQRALLFRPDASATRAEALKMLLQSLEAARVDWRSQSTTQSACAFTDVRADDWFYRNVQDAVQHGLISCQGQFRPQDAITRQEFAKIAYLALLHFDASKANAPAGTTLQPFVDATVFDPSLLRYAQMLRAHGILGGYPDGHFRPLQQVTRGQIAKIAANAFFPLEAGLEFALASPNTPAALMLTPNRIDISSLDVSFANLETAEKQRAGNQGLDFAHYIGFAPSVAYSSALMSAASYASDGDIQNWLDYYGLKLLGLHTQDITWSNDNFRFFVASRQTSTGHTEYVVAIRGTDGFQNILTDLSVGNLKLYGVYPQSCAPAQGWCHKGFHELAMFVVNTLVTDPDYGVMRTQLGLNGSNSVVIPNARLTVAGHSLGGAAAHIVHALLIARTPATDRITLSDRVQSYSIGAPISGDSTFSAANAKQRMYRVRREADPVPTVGAGFFEDWSAYGSHVGEQHGFAHTTHLEGLTQGGGTTNSPFEVADLLGYAHVPPDSNWPHPAWIGSSASEHGSGAYTELLRNFLSHPIAQGLQSRAQRIQP